MDEYFFSCDANFFEMIEAVLYKQYSILGSLTCYNPILWMIPYLMLGSFLIYAFCAIFARSGSRLRIFIYILLILIFSKTMFLAMILGMILSDMDTNNIFQDVNKFVLLVITFTGNISCLIYQTGFSFLYNSLYRFYERLLW